MDRAYDLLLKEHATANRQMAFLSGPRQVGKTTCAKLLASDGAYFNWDNQKNRADIIKGPDEVALQLQLDQLRDDTLIVAFDEIHKYGRWKQFLKGMFDSYEKACRIIVTGSSRLNVYKRGGDSLMGRYFHYRMHPLSVGELCRTRPADSPIARPKRIHNDAFLHLKEFGGFPEPFIKATQRFYNRWRRMRSDLLFKEDLRDLTRVQELAQVEMLAEILRHLSGQLLNYSSLSQKINCSVDSVRRWIGTLESLHYCFVVRPWHKNVAKALRKQPKAYLWDWSLVDDVGARNEAFVASHLLKAVHWWTDTGLGRYELFFLRDKQKREVDFLVVRDGTPWFLVEAKTSSQAPLSNHLDHFHQVLDTAHAFQIMLDAPYVERDCFEERQAIKVPALTLLSQFV